jgi:hypothetical protein
LDEATTFFSPVIIFLTTAIFINYVRKMNIVAYSPFTSQSLSNTPHSRFSQIFSQEHLIDLY